jgi:xanthine dehydrogenase YagS FAD-binding subunit
VKGLGEIAVDAKSGLRIGALATLAQIAAHEAVTAGYPAVALAAGRAATPQIRNVATAGGNLLQRPRCWYFRSEHFHCRKKGGAECFAIPGDNRYHAIFMNDVCPIVHPSALAVPLVAYGAKVEVVGPAGKREVLLEDLFVPPEKDITREHSLAEDEVLTEIRVPAWPAGSMSHYEKLMDKQSYDWPVADCAVVLEREGDRVTRASVVLGAAAPIPWRAKAAEAALKGTKLDAHDAATAAKAALHGAKALSMNGYKLGAFEAIVRRAILAAAGGAR